MIDDIRAFRNPIILGVGTAFLPPLDRHTHLELAGSRVFQPGVIYEHYRVQTANA